MSERRYIRTSVDNRPTILLLTKCNFCPFFKVDTNKFSRCLRFKDVDNRDTITYIHAYSFKYSSVYDGCLNEPTFDVDIPKWCKLDESLASDKVDLAMYTVVKDEIIRTTNVANTLVVISDKFIKRDRDFKYITDKIPTTTKTPQETRYENEYSRLPVITPTIPEVKKLICSCCGESMETVERNKNLGMCKTCWDENNNNIEIKKFSFINNFRLKRKNDYIPKFVKIVSEIKID
jgi:hypothetical protein